VAEIAHAPVGLPHRHAIERQRRRKNGPVLLEAVDPDLYVLLSAAKGQLQPNEAIPAQDTSIPQPQDELGLLEPDLPFEGERRLIAFKDECKDQTESGKKVLRMN
jgi:hypothetical protein